MNAVLRILVGWLLPIPLIVCLFFLIGDVFHLNNLDPEHLRLSENEFLLLDYVFSCVMAYAILGLPFLVFSLALEFIFRPKVLRYCAAGVFGMTVGGFSSWLITPSFAQLSTWHILEACSHLFGHTAIVVCVAMAIELMRTFAEGVGGDLN